MKKVVKILILVLIPLLAGFGIGVYAYGRYQSGFYSYYMDEASDSNTEDRLISFLEFKTQNLEYEKEDDDYKFYYSQKLTNDSGELFTLSIIRATKVIEEAYYNNRGNYLGVKDVYYITYYVALYDVNYKNVATSLDPTGEHGLKYTEIPSFNITLKDSEDEDITSTFTLATVASTDDTTILDYGYSPEKDDKGNKLNNGVAMPMRYYALEASDLANFSDAVSITVVARSSWLDADSVTEDLVTIELDDLYNNTTANKSDEIKTVLDGFKEAYNEDIFKAGYFKFAFTRYIWWEALIAIILFETVCLSFVIVWSSEDTKTKPVVKKK